MKSTLNLSAYFGRIGFEEEPTGSLDVFKKLHLLHPRAIAFENLNPLLGIPVQLDPASLQKKMIHDSRGGYCFEHNLLFKHVLEALGFHVKGLAARILWNTPEGLITPRGHMLLLVEAEGKQYIADVGFGSLGLTCPLLMEPSTEQETPHEKYKLITDGTEYTLQSFIKNEWKPLYRFNLDEHYLQDYDVTNWYLSNHPESHFVTGLIAARPDINPKRRYALRNNEFSIHYPEGNTEKRKLRSVSEIKRVLERKFLITLAGLPQLDSVLEKVINQVPIEKENKN
jgi:N-hydroxyarylamine O-acetyltransferase